MSLDPKDIFTKVGSAEERGRLLDDLIRLKVELVCKLGEMDDLVRLETIKNEGGRLTCALRKGSISPSGLPAQAVASFEMINEKFFLTATLSALQAGYFDLNVREAPIFRLQRRQSFRVRIPDRYLTKVSVIRMNGESVNVTGKVADLSAGGIRLLVTGERKHFKTGDELEGLIALGRREPFKFQGQIRHERSEATPPHHHFGIEFKNLPANVASTLFATTLELHRESLSRWE